MYFLKSLPHPLHCEHYMDRYCWAISPLKRKITTILSQFEDPRRGLYCEIKWISIRKLSAGYLAISSILLWSMELHVYWIQYCTQHILYCAYGVSIFINWSNLQHCKYGVSQAHTLLKKFSKQVGVVNDPYNSLQISARIPRTWRILLFWYTIIEIDGYVGVLIILNEYGDLCCMILAYKYIIPFISNKIFIKFIGREKRYSLKHIKSNEPLTKGCKLRSWKQQDFSMNYRYIRQCFICSRLSTYQVFFEVLL